ncbi:MAG: hypothetical protein WCX69_01525 [Candidatus Paceibacterota bacterium]
MEQQLLNYVEQESKRGVPEHMVKKALHDAGWSDDQINEAFEVVQSRVVPPAPESDTFLKDEAVFGVEDDSNEETAKKTKKPVVVAILVFVALAATVAGLILYYNYSSAPRDPSEGEDVAPENKDMPIETPSDGEKITEPPVSGNNNEPVAVPDANPNQNDATSTLSVAGDPAVDEAAARDSQRMADMKELVSAQKKWYATNKSYYTCGLAGGDCKGKIYGYPLQIGMALEKTPQDPLAIQFGEKKLVCGKNYVYCGLNNTPYSQFFCYYAKLEGGGYYTASREGNFKRSTLPKIFEECAVAN